MNLCSVLIASIQLGWKLAFISVVTHLKEKRYPKEAMDYLVKSLQRVEDTETAPDILHLAEEISGKTDEFEAAREKADLSRMLAGYPDMEEKVRKLGYELDELKEAADKLDPETLKARISRWRSDSYTLESQMRRRY